VNTKVILRQNIFGRWIVVHANDQELAWSGSQWVAIEGSEVQVSNFEERGDAQSYAEQFNFEVIIE
jgi:hypothetical protein